MSVIERVEKILEHLPNNVLDEDWVAMLSIAKENHLEKIFDAFNVYEKENLVDNVELYSGITWMMVVKIAQSRKIPIRELRDVYVKGLKIENILPYPQIFDWCALSLKKIVLEIINYPKLYSWLEWETVSMDNEHITLEIIEKYPNCPWDMLAFAGNPNATIKHIENYLKIYNPDVNNLDVLDRIFINKKVSFNIIPAFDLTFVSWSRNITLKDIEDNITLDWRWSSISQNPNLTVDFVLKYPTKRWNYYNISRNAGITMNDIESNPGFRWLWDGVSSNPNLTIDMLYKHRDKAWNWYCVTKNRAITPEMILLHKDLPFDMTAISAKRNLTSNFILQHPEIEWDINKLLRNPMHLTQKQTKKKLKVLEQKLIKVKEMKDLLYSLKTDTIFSFLVNDILDMISSYA